MQNANDHRPINNYQGQFRMRLDVLIVIRAMADGYYQGEFSIFGQMITKDAKVGLFTKPSKCTRSKPGAMDELSVDNRKAVAYEGNELYNMTLSNRMTKFIRLCTTFMLVCVEITHMSSSR